MSMSSVFVVLSLMLIFSSSRVCSQLQVGFYAFSCPFAEFIVKEEVRREFFVNKGVAAGLVRMHFHDCFVRGCDGSVLIDSTPSNTAEKDSPANNPSLRGFEVIDRAKARIERRCESTVSCADILAFAARDSVELTRGLGYPVPAGRRDGRVSLDSEANSNLPGPTSNVDQLTQVFEAKGLTQQEMVTLSGAHTIGRSHCSSFSNRLYNFNATTSQDPSLDPIYAAELKQLCPSGNQNSVVPMDPFSPAITDNSYYHDLLENRGLFESDQTLITDQATLNQVTQNAANQRLWLHNFAAAMVKMGRLEDQTGSPTEIRIDCRVVN